MARQTIDENLKRFVRLNLSEESWNTQYSFQVVLLLLLTASWNASTIHARASMPNADTVHLRFSFQALEEMEAEFYRQNLVILKKLRWDKRKKLFLVADETHDPYCGKFWHKWIHKYKPKKGCTGSFCYLTIALVAPGQWRRVVRCIPMSVKTDMTKILTETAVKIRAKIPYAAFLLDRGFYDKKYAFALQRVGIPFIIRAELRGRIKKRFEKITTQERFLHWQQQGHDCLFLWLGWKYRGEKRFKWGYLTNLNLKWSQCVYWYKRRWNIENIFKATDGIQLHIATAKIKPRLFAVLLSFMAYNEWQKRKHASAEPMSLSIFLEEMINTLLVTYLKTGPPILLHIPGWNINTTYQGESSFHAFSHQKTLLLCLRHRKC